MNTYKKIQPNSKPETLFQLGIGLNLIPNFTFLTPTILGHQDFVNHMDHAV